MNSDSYGVEGSTLALMRFVKAHGSNRVQAQLRDWIRRDSELTDEVAALREELRSTRAELTREKADCTKWHDYCVALEAELAKTKDALKRTMDQSEQRGAERDHYFAKMESVNLQRQRNEVRAIEAEAERDAWRDRHNEKAQLVKRFLAERDAIRPVFEAACKARDSDDYAEDMWNAVDAFRAAQQETTNGHH